MLPSKLITTFHIKMTNHVFQCNKYQERIQNIKSGKIMISSNIKDFIIILLIYKVIVFLCKIKMKVNNKFFAGILLITVHVFKMFWQLGLQSSSGATNPCRVVKNSPAASENRRLLG